MVAIVVCHYLLIIMYNAYELTHYSKTKNVQVIKNSK